MESDKIFFMKKLGFVIFRNIFIHQKNFFFQKIDALFCYFYFSEWARVFFSLFLFLQNFIVMTFHHIHSFWDNAVKKSRVKVKF